MTCDDHDDPLASDLAAKACEQAGHAHRYPDCREPVCRNRYDVLEKRAPYYPTAAERLEIVAA